ncbi:MAG TPA: hypothetical protein VMM56_08035, partial [Planctomycetaceae bacterium]|nr:hypothetical protein [Planctomycetaceae bacterium]
FSESLAWSGVHNWYRGFQKFRTINDSLGFSSLEDLDFESWREYWTLEEQGYEENAVSKEIFWQSTWQDKPYSTFAPDQFKLDLALIDDDRVYSEDGTPVGVLTESLPIPFEYRSLKRETGVQPPLESLAEPTLDD